MTPPPPAGRAAAAASTHDGDTLLERVAGQRLRLQAVATALAQSLDPHAVATQVLEAACSVTGAPLGWIALLSSDGKFVEIVEAVGYDPSVVAPWSRVPMDLAVPMTEAIRTGLPLYHASGDERRAAYPALLAVRPGGEQTEASSVIPFVFEGRSTGALSVSFREPRTLDADERWFLESLAAQASAGLERARLFAEVRDHDERLQFTLAATGTGTWEWDLDGNGLEWSAIVYDLHARAHELAPPSFDEWIEQIHPDDRSRVMVAIEACLRDGGPYDIEMRIQLPGGGIRWLHSFGRMVTWPGASARKMIGTTRDVSDRKAVEAERERRIELEREAARLREAFIGVVSHELRTPITTIFGGTRVLARRWREMEPAARDDLLGDVVDEADRLYRLVEDLLVITNVERGMLDVGDEPLNVGRVIERVIAAERPRHPAVTIEVLVPADLPSVMGEDAYLEQILRNLLANAAKYGGSGSTVTVTAAQDGDEVVLCVGDEGPGIDPAETDRLFELFYRSPRTAATAPGAGIGLFVCRQLVVAMGGSITVSQRPGGGATFCVRLPRATDDGT